MVIVVISDKVVGVLLDKIHNSSKKLGAGILTAAFWGCGRWGCSHVYTAGVAGLHGSAIGCGLFAAWAAAVSLTATVSPVVEWVKNKLPDNSDPSL